MPSNVEVMGVLRGEVVDEEKGLGLESAGADDKSQLTEQARAGVERSEAGSSKAWWGVPVPAAACRGVKALRLFSTSAESAEKEDKEPPLVLVSETVRDTSGSGSEEASQGSAGEGRERVLVWNVAKLQVARPGRAKGCKTLLSNIVGWTRSGEFTAIMGPSGAGKSTLLECLSLRNRTFEGSVQLDGQALGGEYFTQAALVPQKELLFGFMTPREHLLFHAIARMGSNAHPHTIQARIEEVLLEMNLCKCADTVIGGSDPIFLRKGLSGGEAKRLVIATELLHCPNLLFLDEPTSGLDSVMAESVTWSLSELRRKGKVVMASVHSPSSEMVRLFSHLLLLTGDGRLAFHGPMTDALRHFETLGHSLSLGYSASDFLLRLVSKDSSLSSLPPSRQHSHSDVHDLGDLGHSTYTATTTTTTTHNYTTTHDGGKARLDALVTAWRSSSFNTAPTLPPDNAHRSVFSGGVRGVRASSLQLFKLNVWRGALQTRRDVLSFGLWGVALGVMGLVFGVLYLHQASGGNWRNLMGLLFSATVSVLFTAAVAHMVRFPLEWTVVAREYLSGSNAMGPYISAKAVFDLPYLYGPTLLILILYTMTGMDPSPKVFGLTWLSFLLISQASTATGLFLASFSPNPLVGLALMPCVVTPMVMFSGMLYQRSSLPPWLSWLEHLSIVNYGFSALLGLQVHRLTPAGAKLVLGFTEIDPSNLRRDLLMLCVMTMLGYAMTYANLRLRLATASKYT